MALTACPIWNEGSVLPSTGGDYFEIESRRSGGRYRIAGSANALLKARFARTPLLRAKLTTWIVDQHRSGENCPLITTTVLDAVESRRTLRLSEQIDRFFLLLTQRNFRIGDYLTVSGPVDEKQRNDVADLCAWLEFARSTEVSDFKRLLIDLGLVAQIGETARIALSAEGFRRLEAVQSSSTTALQAFIAMWFDSTMHGASDQGFAKAIEAAGYKPMRIDKKEHNNKIDDEIVAEIRRSKFLVADFTCGTVEVDGISQAIARGGVYFEAGYAMGLGIPVIWTCRKNIIDCVHFDTRQFSHVVWETPDELRVGLYNRICATIGETPGAPGLR